MHINIVLIPLIILLGLLFSSNDSSKTRKLYIVLSSIILILVAALRSPEWMFLRYGIDSLGYKEEFERSLDLSWRECWNLAFSRYFANEGEYDIGYTVLNKIIGWFTNKFYIFSILANLIFFIPLGVLLSRYTTNMRQLVFAFVFYIALVQIFLFGGARQIFAIGFDMMALLAMVDKKRFWSLFLFLIGVTIHFSSFLFLLPLLMVCFNTSPRILKWAHVLGFMLFPLVLAFPNQVIVFLGETSGIEKYTNYGMSEIQGGAITFIFLIEALSLFCLLAIKQSDLINNSIIRVFYVMVPFFTLLAPLIRSSGSMIRISLYYHMYLMLLVPYAIDCLFKNKDKTIIYIVSIVALAFLALQGGGIEYYFFWQK